MAETVHFSTSLRPHRSLSPVGFKWLIRAVILANLVIGLPMYLLGAWPVLGFAGLDVALLWWLFHRNYADARRSETLELTDRELVVTRVAPDGEREEHRLESYWLRVEQGDTARARLGERGRNRRHDAPLSSRASCSAACAACSARTSSSRSPSRMACSL